MYRNTVIRLIIIDTIAAVCPLYDAKEGIDLGKTVGTTAFMNVAGTGGTGIHSPLSQTGPQEGSQLTSSEPQGDGYTEHRVLINQSGYTGCRQNTLPGFHSLDYDIFGNGSLNHSYSKSLDGSFYGRTDDDPMVSELIKTPASSSLMEPLDKEADSIGKIKLNGTDGAGGGLVAGSNPSNGNGTNPNSLAAQPSNGETGGLSSSGSTGKTFKFNQLSTEASLSDYSRFFTASKLFAFNPTLDGIYKIVLVSTTKEYHPQMKILEINKAGGEKYIEKFGYDQENGMYSSRYALRKDREYLVEIGASEKIDFTPFANINTGGFICIISAEKKSLQEVLGQEVYRISIYGKMATISLGQNETLELGGLNENKEGSGMLDYSVTPFYNSTIGSITIFFHNESSFSNGLSSTAKQAAVVEFECHPTSNSTRMYEGIEAKSRIIEFNLQCRSVCDLIDMLK